MNLFNKLNQIKDLKSQAKNLQNQLSAEIVTVEKHGITLEMDGNQKIVRLDISPELLSPDKKSNLESLIKDLQNDAIGKIQKIMAEKMKAMGGLGNLNIPGLS